MSSDPSQLNPQSISPKIFSCGLPQCSGGPLHGDPGSPTFESNFPASPKSLPASPHPGGGPPSRGDVSPAPPPAGALWPNMANTAVLGSWDRLGGRGSPWLGRLAAGEGEGSPGGSYKDSQGEKWDHRPFRCLMGTYQIHFLGTLVWAEAPTQGCTGDPHPIQPCIRTYVQVCCVGARGTPK